MPRACSPGGRDNLPYRAGHLKYRRKHGLGQGDGRLLDQPDPGIHKRNPRRDGDSVWDIYQLGVGADLLGDEAARVGVNEQGRITVR